MQPERALKMTQKENKVHYVSTDHPSCQVGLLEVFQEGDAIDALETYENCTVELLYL